MSGDKFKNQSPSSMWFKRSKECNKLSLRAGKFTSKDSADFSIHSNLSLLNKLSLWIGENLSLDLYDMCTEETKQDLFDVYSSLVKTLNVSSDEIYNVDESGMQVVTKSPKIICKRRSKNVIVKKSGEKSETISVCACINASASSNNTAFLNFQRPIIIC